MGHHISAALLRGPFDKVKARDFDMAPIDLGFDITMFPLMDVYCDYWADSLGIQGFVSARPLLNCRVVHHMINSIAKDPLFAIIETDYAGGIGDQAARLYKGHNELKLSVAMNKRPPDINDALKALGVLRHSRLDEFDTVGLGRFRDFDDLFKKYWINDR